MRGRARGFEIAQLESLGVHTLAEKLRSDDVRSRPFVLDVRTGSELDGGHIEGAHHIPGGLLQERVGEVPTDRPVAVILRHRLSRLDRGVVPESRGCRDVAKDIVLPVLREQLVPEREIILPALQLRLVPQDVGSHDAKPGGEHHRQLARQRLIEVNVDAQALWHA